MSCKENLLKREVIYKGKIINVYNDTITFAGLEKQSNREIVEHNGGVCAVVKTKNNKIKFVKQFRYAVNEDLLELPAGKIEKGEDPDYTIAREIEEEVGISANKIIKIGKIYPTPGYCTEVLHLYYVDDYEECETRFDENEYLDEFEYTYQEAIEMIENGTIVDAKTICLLLRVREKFI